MAGVGKLCCKGPERNFLRLCGLYTVSPSDSSLLLKEAINNMEIHDHCSAPMKLLLQNQVTGPFDLWTSLRTPDIYCHS